jgi:serine phosphatase RsbU (regulator of sigma subunit)
MKKGVYDYLLKPLNMNELLLKVSRAFEKSKRDNDFKANLKIARAVQQELLSDYVEQFKNLKTAYRHIPLIEIGGDYFFLKKLADDELGIFIADVTGHGISAALFISLVKATSERLLEQHGDKPKQYLEKLNVELFNHMLSYFVTAIYAKMKIYEDESKMEFIFSSGGHTPPILYRHKSEKAKYLKIEGSIIGLFEEKNFNQAKVTLEKGDRIFLYTDGLIEINDDLGNPLGKDLLIEIVRQASKYELNSSLDNIIHNIREKQNVDHFYDDVLIIGLEVK